MKEENARFSELGAGVHALAIVYWIWSGLGGGGKMFWTRTLIEHDG